MKKIYFVSDSHLGVPDAHASMQREKALVHWLEMISEDASEVFLLGDIFDFWFEYRYVVPRGYVRLLGKLAELTDRGIPVHYFTGNHDMWTFGYLENEVGLIVHRGTVFFNRHGKKLMIGHGDGLGKGDYSFKMIRRVFSSRFCQRMFAFIHPGTGIRLALFLSGSSRRYNRVSDKVYLGKEKEVLFRYCQQVHANSAHDYYIFGHRHLPLHEEIAPGAFYVNTGDWVQHFSYAVLDQGEIHLERFKPAH